MARFSERIGAKPPKTVLQLNSMDEELRNGLWNSVNLTLWPLIERHQDRNGPSFGDVFFQRLWLWHYKLPIDLMPAGMEERVTELRDRFFGWDWIDVYDFMDFAAQSFPHDEAQDSLIRRVWLSCWTNLRKSDRTSCRRLSKWGRMRCPRW
jgi:hypothetical protein